MAPSTLAEAQMGRVGWQIHSKTVSGKARSISVFSFHLECSWKSYISVFEAAEVFFCLDHVKVFLVYFPQS